MLAHLRGSRGFAPCSHFLILLLAVVAVPAEDEQQRVHLDVGLESYTLSRGILCSGCPLVRSAHMSAWKRDGSSACMVEVRFNFSSLRSDDDEDSCRSPGSCAPQERGSASASGVGAVIDGRSCAMIRGRASEDECARAARAAALEAEPTGEGGAMSLPGAIACHDEGCAAVWTVVPREGEEHRLVLSLATPTGLPVAADVRADFLLVGGNGGAGCKAAQPLPARRGPRGAQKVPFERTSPGEAGEAHCAARAAALAARVARRLGPEGAADAPGELQFHPGISVDLSRSATRLPAAVRVGGLGNVSLAWPDGAPGPLGRPGVFLVKPISYAAYEEHLRERPLPKVWDFAPYRPGRMSAYRSRPMYGPLDEAAYLDDYARSFFALTRCAGMARAL